MGEVVGLGDRTPPAPDGTEPQVIALLEELLAEARRGEIVAFATAVIRPNREIGTRSSNPVGHRHLLIAGAVYLMSDLAQEK
jgi:hypothetical protein